MRLFAYLTGVFQEAAVKYSCYDFPLHYLELQHNDHALVIVLHRGKGLHYSISNNYFKATMILNQDQNIK